VLTRVARRKQSWYQRGQVVIVMSLMEPALKPHLIDRYLASESKAAFVRDLSEQGGPIDPADYQSDIGFYSQLACERLLTSETGLGIDQLKTHLRGQQTVFSGRAAWANRRCSTRCSGLELACARSATSTGRASTRRRPRRCSSSTLAAVFGTPGIRQFELWTSSGGSGGFLPNSDRGCLCLSGLHAHA
jgi:ribosome biogenesis GTPase